VVRWLHDLLAIRESVIEVALNVLLFVPLSLVGWYVVRQGIAFWVVAGLVLSVIIELVQLTIPGRTTTLSDVIANTSGAALGALGCALWGARNASRTTKRP
jgi:glycopeptide antibiotics resistance protein